DELKVLVTPWRHTDGLHGGVRIVEGCIGDDLAADLDAATPSVDDGLRDVLAAGLLSAGMRAPETRRAADNLLTDMRCGADASLASRFTAGRRRYRIAVGIDRTGGAVGLTCVLRHALARLAAGQLAASGDGRDGVAGGVDRAGRAVGDVDVRLHALARLAAGGLAAAGDGRDGVAGAVGRAGRAVRDVDVRAGTLARLAAGGLAAAGDGGDG